MNTKHAQLEQIIGFIACSSDSLTDHQIERLQEIVNREHRARLHRRSQDALGRILIDLQKLMPEDRNRVMSELKTL